MEPEKLKLACGNFKIGKNTFIMNITSATDCSAKSQCTIVDKCYALKAERFRPTCLPSRREQTKAFDGISAMGIANEILARARRKKKTPIEYLRISESGDFRGQADVDKISEIAMYLAPFDIKVYTYTARQDLDYSEVSNNLTVNGSGFMVHNNFTAMKDPSAAMADGWGLVVCPGDCRDCNLCTRRLELDIAVKIH